jgi:hypothetical protein
MRASWARAEKAMNLYLRKVVHPQAHDNYRVVLNREFEIGSIGIQRAVALGNRHCHPKEIRGVLADIARNCRLAALAAALEIWGGRKEITCPPADPEVAHAPSKPCYNARPQ